MTGSGPEAYEHHLVPAIFAPWAAVLLELARLQPGERVLDAACGTGVVARAAMARVGTAGKVTGVDLNPGMLEVARTVSGRAGQSIAWREGNLEALPFADGAFDVVLCQQGLQFCTNKAAAVSELRRVLREGGRLGLSVWRDIRHCPYMVAVTGTLVDLVGPQASQRMSAPARLAAPMLCEPCCARAGSRTCRSASTFCRCGFLILKDFCRGSSWPRRSRRTSEPWTSLFVSPFLMTSGAGSCPIWTMQVLPFPSKPTRSLRRDKAP